MNDDLCDGRYGIDEGSEYDEEIELDEDNSDDDTDDEDDSSDEENDDDDRIDEIGTTFPGGGSNQNTHSTHRADHRSCHTMVDTNPLYPSAPQTPSASLPTNMHPDRILAITISAILGLFSPPLGPICESHIQDGCFAFVNDFKETTEWRILCDKLLLLTLPNCSVLKNQRIQSLRNNGKFLESWSRIRTYDYHTNPARFLLGKWCDIAQSFVDK